MWISVAGENCAFRLMDKEVSVYLYILIPTGIWEKDFKIWYFNDLHGRKFFWKIKYFGQHSDLISI